MLLLAAVLPAMTACERLPEVRVIGDRGYRPYEYCEQGETRAEGILVEQWRLMGSRAGLRISYTCDDWEKALKAVLEGKADAIGGMFKSPEREQQYRFIKSLSHNPTYLYYRKQNDELSLETIALEGRAVGVVKSDYAVERLRQQFPNLNFNSYGSYPDVVSAAQRREINVFVMEEAVAADLMTRSGIVQLFTRGAAPLFRESLWAAVRKENVALATQLEEGFRKVTDDELAKLEQNPKPPPDLREKLVGRALEWAHDNPVMTALGAFLLAYLLVIGGLFAFAPLRIYRFSGLLRQTKIQASGWIEIVLRIISLVALIDTSPRILNAWLADRLPAIRRNFSGRKTVDDRKKHYLLPFVVGDERVEILSVQERTRRLVTRLRTVFSQPGACVLIAGEGGSGKTSLACWVARNALQMPGSDHPDERVFPKLTVPIMLEGQLNQPVFDAIHSQFVALAEEEVPKDTLTALMRNGQVLVIVDGLSEFDSASREKIETVDAAVPRFPLIVTSRRDTTLLGGMAKTDLRPLKASGTVVVGFLEFLLREAGLRDKLTDTELFTSCANLSTLVGGKDISPLLIVLYAQLLAPTNGGAATSLPTVTSIPDIFLEFVNRLNGSLKQDRIGNAEVHGHLRAIAWACVSDDYRPHPRLRADLLDLSEDTEAILRYVEDRLGLIETIAPAQTHVRFLLDPLAEYLAAAYLFNEGAANNALRTFLAHVALHEDAVTTSLGFCRAVIDTAFAKKEMFAQLAPDDRQGLEALREQLRERASESFAAPSADIASHGPSGAPSPQRPGGNQPAAP
jgi:ABC-type amino acid transport substrate-binding protein